ncbi:ribonuclease E inhibitor RraA/Dimethylmenaquinone methyltransferase [Aspergillus avenaceus]|uniref:Ribonuclease E inhibitor RraA/Dimethylmenaquinone methyltransferase n=1 Tax=Aspergillus avenaceus TaxID=36643 RepID=A0A5N6U4G4_ASPAV|nr:ribonuclease E inhibitor RraA/Dimethylmenaquinone methyltransferase [Aspergillus avenaceus]
MWSPTRQAGSTKIIGQAYTVRYGGLDEQGVEGHYIDNVPQNSVIFISAPDHITNAVYGGLMSTRAKVRGAVGAVIDGRFRDLEEQRGLGFPIWAKEPGTAPPYPVVKVTGINVPLTISEGSDRVTVKPGDYIIADLNGVVCLPADLVDSVIPLMERQADADEKVRGAVLGGMGFVEAVGLFR